MRSKILPVAVACAMGVMAAPAAFASDSPSTEMVKGLILEHLQTLRPQGFSERDVSIQDIRPGNPTRTTPVSARNPDSLPLSGDPVDAGLRAGYPPNHYFGSTCISHMNKSVFVAHLDDFGSWTVEGAWTPTERNCQPNPPR